MTNQELQEMVKMGDKKKNGGVDKDDFMDLMHELGLWGKEEDKNKDNEPLLNAEV